jgi:hypothetical protein
MTWRRLLALAALITGPASAALGSGGLTIYWDQPYGNWAEGPATGTTPANWHQAAADGRVYLRDLPAGYHTIGITRAFGLGPLVMPFVRVEDGRTTSLNVGFHTDYYALPGTRSIKGNVFVQPFVATGESIIKAGAFLAAAPEERKVKYSVWEAGPNGRQVGPEAVRPPLPGLTGFMAAWCHGQVPVTPGGLYYLKIVGAKGAPLEVSLSDTADPLLPLIVDGQPVAGASLAGWVESDPPGIFTTMACLEGHMKPDPGKDACQAEVGQSFIAQGTSLAMVDFHPYVEGVEGDVEYRIVIREGGVRGGGMVRTYVSGPNGSVIQAIWEPGEVPLTPGQEYFVEMIRAEGGGFKFHKTVGEVCPSGTIFVDELAISHYDLEMNIVEYGRDVTPPAPPTIGVCSGDGLTRIECTAPSDPDVRKVQIRWRLGNTHERWPVSPAQDHLLAEVDVVPGQVVVVHHEGLSNYLPYLYAAYAIDFNGNFSRPDVAGGWHRAGGWPGKGPVLPPQATILNPDFASTCSMGAYATGWESRVQVGSPIWQAFQGEHAMTSYGWTATADGAAELFQTVTLHPGRRYELTVKARGTGTASAAIGRAGGGDDVTLTPLTDDWKSLKVVFVAERPDTRIFLSGATQGQSTIQFAEVRIADITAR